MKLIAICSIIMVLACVKVSGQTINAEVAGMTHYTSVTGSFYSPITKNHKLSFTAASRYYLNYEDENMAAVFSNLGYSLTPSFSVTAGAMYFGGTPTPMTGIQAMFGKKAVTGMFAPSLTFGEDLSVLMISQVQYLKPVKEATDFVSKVMLLGMIGFNGDVFSRLSLRSGLTKGRLGYGLAADIDMKAFDGDDLEISSTVGAYVQYNISL